MSVDERDHALDVPVLVMHNGDEHLGFARHGQGIKSLFRNPALGTRLE